MRIVSWNIHGSVGADLRCDPERVLGVIAALQPDILALQEIDGRTHLGRRPRAFEAFAEALGEHLVEARLLVRSDRDSGHLLWSRWPIVDGTVRRLPGGRIEPRAAIDAVCLTPQGPLRVLSVHFGLFPSDRRAQAKALAAFAETSAMPTIALGDFNEWRKDGPVHRSLSAVLPQSLRPVTWPSRRPFVRMDRLYASADVEILPASGERAPAAAARASDHLPVVADIGLPAE